MRRTLGSPFLALLFFAAVFLCGTPASAAGQWLRTYQDADGVADIEPVPAGGHIAVGTTSSFAGTDGNDVWVVRLDANGGVLWDIFFSNPGNDFGYAVTVTQDGGFVVAAILGGFTCCADAWIVRLDPDGRVQWQKRYGGAGNEGSSDIVQLADGGFVFVGWAGPGGPGNANFWTVRLDADGEIVWQRTFETGVVESASYVRLTSDGAILVVGYSFFEDPFSYTTKNLLVKYDLGGEVLVQRCFSYWGEGEFPVDVAALPDGGYVLTAATDTPWGGNQETMLHRLDANLASVWNRMFWRDLQDFAPRGIAALPDGGVLLSAWSFDQVGPSILRTDANGSIVGQQGYGGAAANLSFGNLLLETDGISVAGATGGRALVGRLSPEGLLPASCASIQSFFLRTQTNSLQGSCSGISGTATGTAQATAFLSIRPPGVTTTRCEDLDADGWETAQDSCPLVPNPAQTDADIDGFGDLCDRCPAVYDPAQVDGDADGRGDACDVCPAIPDPAQNDVDEDGAGDLCDTSDGLLFFTGVTRQFVSWQPDASFASYNLYRGSLPELQASGAYTQISESNACASRLCDLAGTSAADGTLPLGGEPCFWLVTGEGAGGESGLEVRRAVRVRTTILVPEHRTGRTSGRFASPESAIRSPVLARIRPRRTAPRAATATRAPWATCALEVSAPAPR